MPDRDKVIKGLSCCAKWMEENDTDACESCPYHPHYCYVNHHCLEEVNNDAISLLKKQEPKPVVITTNEYGTKFYRCPNCNKNFYEPWELYKDYCYACGQAVIW